MANLFDGLKIPTDFDTDVDVSINQKTMMFLGGIFLLYLIAKKRKIL